MPGPLVSIVTPVLNGEEHLPECIESIRRQTYTNWEYVVVDNCSSDRTPEIAKSSARTDRRIRHERHETRVDVISSYNRAFAAISSEHPYCKVVGADDWLHPDCIERMVELAEANPTVGVVSAYRQNYARVGLDGLPYWQTVVPGRDVVHDNLLGRLHVTGSPTALLFRTQTVRNRQPFFDSSFLHADTEAALFSLLRCDLGFVHQVLTFNRPSPMTARSGQLKSVFAEYIRMLIRYGPVALTDDEYRPRLRRCLNQYLRWLAKQRLKPASSHPPDFWAFQDKTVRLMLAEVGDEPDLRRSMRAVRLFIRRRVGSGSPAEEEVPLA